MRAYWGIELTQPRKRFCNLPLTCHGNLMILIYREVWHTDTQVLENTLFNYFTFFFSRVGGGGNRWKNALCSIRSGV